MAHKEILRPAIIHNMINMLSCGTSSRGHARYDCPNPDCTHTKRVLFTCKSRSCPSCGKKATYQWSAKQQAILPATKWQHIVMTMPKELWRLFQLNRHLLNDLSPLAASCIQTLAKNQHLTPGIFTALHTFGRDLKWNVHVHLSTTCGGLTTNGNWQQLYYKKQTLMRMWRYRVVDLLREAHKNGRLKLPRSLQHYCPTISPLMPGSTDATKNAGYCIVPNPRTIIPIPSIIWGVTLSDPRYHNPD